MRDASAQQQLGQAYVAAAAHAASDLARCRALGARARETARELDWDGVVVQFEGVMASVLRQAGQPAAGLAPVAAV